MGIYGNYSDLVELAESKVEIIMQVENERIRKAAFYKLLVGFGPEFEIKINPGSEHNYQAAVDGIYSYYRKFPSSGIDEVLDCSIRQYLIILSRGSLRAMAPTIHIFEYLYDKQKNREAPFVLDIKTYMMLLKKEVIDINASLPKYPMGFENVDFKQYLEEKSRYFTE